MENITTLSIHELSQLIKSRKLSAVELTEAYLKNIYLYDGDIGAYLTVTQKNALQRAREIDKLQSSDSPLCALPYSVKDNICTNGIATTCASKILENFIPCYDADVISTLKSKNALMLGKVNMDEFGIGGSTEASAFHITKNPVDLSLVPGGSSGASASSVASDMCAFSIGTDTGGSVRQPAAFCGVVGIKPTYGLISRYGLVAFASSLDTVGVITKNVFDSAIVLQELAKHDPKDSTSVFCDKTSYTEKIQGDDVKKMVIGLPKELMDQSMDSEIKQAVLNSAKAFSDMGAYVTEISMPSLKHALAAYYIISSAEASSNLSRFDGVRYTKRAESFCDLDSLYVNTRSSLLGKEVKRRIAIGTYVLSSGYYDEYYAKAQKVRGLICKDYKNAFEKCNILLSPTTPTLPYKTGSNINSRQLMYSGDIFTVGASLCGVPALSMPYGSSKGIPIGVQLSAKHFDEETLYKAAFALESYARREL